MNYLIGFLIGFVLTWSACYLTGFFIELLKDRRDKKDIEESSRLMEYKRNLDKHQKVLEKQNASRFQMYRDLAELGKCGNCGSDSISVYPINNGASFAYQCGKCGIGL